MGPRNENILSPLETATIELRLTLPDPREVKSALQVLCAQLEKGRIIADKSSISPKLVPLLFDDDVQVRRWSYKAVALLKHPAAHSEALISRICNRDPNPENMTWAVSALFAITPPKKLSELLEQKKLSMDDTMALAARLYRPANADLVKDPRRAIRIDSADPLTLRWVCLLTGYGITVPRLFPKEYTGATIIPQLNGHDDTSVSEYSIWALWQNPEFSIDQITIKKTSFTTRPPNVRRWINRLITKRPEDFSDDLDLIVELSRDDEEKARGGLALGIAPHYVDGLDRRVADWCGTEKNDAVRTVLLEHMASKSELSQLYHQIALDKYKTEQPNSMVRRRIEAAAETTPLFPDLKEVAITEGLRPDMFGTGFGSYVKGDIVLGNKQTISGGRDVAVGVNIGSGDNFGDAKATIQQSTASAQQKAELTKILELLKEREKEAPFKDAISAVTEVAKAPNNSTLAKLKSALAVVKDVAGAASSLGTAVGAAIEAIKAWSF